MVTEERLHRRDILQRSPRDLCVLTHKAVAKSLPGRGNHVRKGTEASNNLQNHGICELLSQVEAWGARASHESGDRVSRQSRKALSAGLQKGF